MDATDFQFLFLRYLVLTKGAIFLQTSPSFTFLLSYWKENLWSITFVPYTLLIFTKMSVHAFKIENHMTAWSLNEISWISFRPFKPHHRQPTALDLAGFRLEWRQYMHFEYKTAEIADDRLFFSGVEQPSWKDEVRLQFLSEFFFF